MRDIVRLRAAYCYTQGLCGSGMPAEICKCDAKEERHAGIVGIARFFGITHDPLVILEMRHGLAHADRLIDRRRLYPFGSFNNVERTNQIPPEIAYVGVHGQSERILSRKPPDNFLYPFLGLIQIPLNQSAKCQIVVGSRQHAKLVFRLQQYAFGFHETSVVQMTEATPDELVEAVQVKNPRLGL